MNRKLFIVTAVLLLIMPYISGIRVSAQESPSPPVQYLDIATSETKPIAIDRLIYMALNNIGYPASFSVLTEADGVSMASSGEKDGVVSPKPDIDKKYAGLIKVPVALDELEVRVYVRSGGNIRFEGSESLQGSAVGILEKSFYTPEDALKYSALSMRPDVKSLMNGLLDERYDFVVLTQSKSEGYESTEGISCIGVLDTVREYLYLNKRHDNLVKLAENALFDVLTGGCGDKVKSNEFIPELNMHKTIVHIISTNSEMTREDEFAAKMRAPFRDDGQIEWYSMALNTKRYGSDSNRLKSIADLLRHDLVSRNVVAVVVSGVEAMNLLLEYYPAMFPGVPVIYYGADNLDTERIQRTLTGFFGIFETITGVETISEALALFPDAKNVYVVNDYTTEGIFYRRAVEPYLDSLPPEINVIYNENAAREDILSQISDLPYDSIVVIGAYFRDAKGQYYSQNEMKRALDENCKVPLFSYCSTNNGYGTIGGKSPGYAAYGETAAGLLGRVLDGTLRDGYEAIRDMPGFNRWLFDMNLLEQWGLKEKDLPSGSIIMNRQPSIWELNPAFAYGLVAFCVFAVWFAVGLSVFSYYKRKHKIASETAGREKEANKLKSVFLSNMSHEIRTPMNAIIGLTDIELRKKPQGESGEIYKKINVSAKNLLQIVNDILDLSKIEADKIDLYLEDFELEDVLNSALLVVSPRLYGKNVEMLLRASRDLPRFINGDKTRVWQILKNILDNAAKYTEKGSIVLDVSIDSRQSSDERTYISFCVRDTGIGMDDERIEKIFLPYEQIYNETQKRYTGTGLGMPISKRFCELMGGSIAIQSKPGEGTVIEFVIPFKKAAGVSHSEKKSDLSDLNVMAVDDSDISLEIIGDILERCGAKYTCAKSGKLAIEALQKSKENKEVFDIILLDYLMEGLNGIETARRIQSLFSTAPKLLMVTAYQRQLLKSELESGGIDGILEKPFIPTKFAEKIRETLGFNDADNDSQPETPKFNDVRILLTEDNVINQEVANGMLSEFGVNVLIAGNGKECVEILESGKDVDLILMDLHMPVMDGYEATRIIRGMRKFDSVPIISLSADAMNEVLDKCLDAGMNDHIAKPVEFESLHDILLKWLPASKRADTMN